MWPIWLYLNQFRLNRLHYQLFNLGLHANVYLELMLRSCWSFLVRVCMLKSCSFDLKERIKSFLEKYMFSWKFTTDSRLKPHVSEGDRMDEFLSTQRIWIFLNHTITDLFPSASLGVVHKLHNTFYYYFLTTHPL